MPHKQTYSISVVLKLHKQRETVREKRSKKPLQEGNNKKEQRDTVLIKDASHKRLHVVCFLFQKIRTNVTEGKSVPCRAQEAGKGLMSKGRGGDVWVTERYISCRLRMQLFVKAHQIIHSKFVNFLSYNLDLNKTN